MLRHTPFFHAAENVSLCHAVLHSNTVIGPAEKANRVHRNGPTLSVKQGDWAMRHKTINVHTQMRRTRFQKLLDGI